MLVFQGSWQWRGKTKDTKRIYPKTCAHGSQLDFPSYYKLETSWNSHHSRSTVFLEDIQSQEIHSKSLSSKWVKTLPYKWTVTWGLLNVLVIQNCFQTNNRGQKKTWVLNYWHHTTSGLSFLIRPEGLLKANATGLTEVEWAPTLSRKINLFAALSFCFSISPTAKGYPDTLLALICNLKVTQFNNKCNSAII